MREKGGREERRKAEGRRRERREGTNEGREGAV